MSNMSYCRFQNTLSDLRDCSNHIDDKVSEDESEARATLIRLAHSIIVPFLDEDVDLDEEAIKDLPVGNEDEEDEEVDQDR